MIRRLLAGLALVSSALAGAADHRLDIYWNDVEGGGATLIVTPAGQSILIDSGNPGTRDSGRIFRNATQVAGLKRIDFFLLTHFHIDHFGGVAELSTRMPIGQVYDNGIPAHDPDHNPSDALWKLTSGPYRSFHADHRNLTHPGLVLPLREAEVGAHLQLRCVACRQSRVLPPAGAKDNPLAWENTGRVIPPTDNDNSAVWVLDYGPFRFFDGGDLTWNMEALLVVPVNRIGQVDVYQTDHHGLEVSNNPVLVHSLAPTVSVMNNGPTKGAAHPTIEALKSSPGIQAMYQLHKNLVHPEDNTTNDQIANMASDPNHEPDHYIKLSVAPDGKTYTVFLSATGNTRTFQTRLNKGL